MAPIPDRTPLPPLPQLISTALDAILTAWEERGLHPNDLVPWLRRVDDFLAPRASHWGHRDRVAVARELYALSDAIRDRRLPEGEQTRLPPFGSIEMMTFLPALDRIAMTVPGDDDEKGDGSDVEETNGDRRQRDRREPRRLLPRQTGDQAERSLSKGAHGPPTYKLQRLRPF
ncbi:hypothetical protein JCM10450v2_005319 [Rhodotorula kratochvilovae]